MNQPKEFVCGAELRFQTEPASRDAMYDAIRAAGADYRSLEPVADSGFFRLEFGVQAADRAAAVEAAEIYVGRVLDQMKRLGLVVTGSCDCGDA